MLSGICPVMPRLPMQETPKGTDLLGEEIDNLQIVRESDAALRQRSRDFQRRDDARDSVEPTAVRNGVGMRAKHEDGPGFASGPRDGR